MRRSWCYILVTVMLPALASATMAPVRHSDSSLTIANIASTTTRYYYDGQNVIEERNAGDARLRYHVHGSQYVDERVATYNEGTGFTYYLLKDNYSVAGTGNVDGTSLQRLAYTALGDFAGVNYSIADIDQDGDVDLTDYAILHSHVNGPTQSGTGTNWQQADLNSDGHVDLRDFIILQACTVEMHTVSLNKQDLGCRFFKAWGGIY